MYIVAPSDPIYHLARSDQPDERMTVCLRMIVSEPNKRRRFGDFRLEPNIPSNRVCVLCSQCALISGDDRSFSERVTYPITKTASIR